MTARSQPDVVRRARALLGRTITGHGVTVRITEVEAYGGSEDPASHAFTRTPRSEIMYGPAYRLYVYRSYGIHLCANVVTGPTEIGAAVLLRAGEVVDGHELARFRRGEAPPKRDVNLARGPGNLAQALGITLDDLGTDLLAEHPPAERHTGVRLGPEPARWPRIASGPRVGVSKAADVPWRFWIEGDPTVSAYRRSPRAPAPGTTLPAREH
ncbi:DNA-3-methyladenine glycosylase [Nocardioides sp. R1-1]|uniref:DNA-3-methyladenine glycosylase n=1 Tax=Nocardioides sp. R1-1 TaxID=3383502 RepID=UPI0038CF701E